MRKHTKRLLAKWAISLLTIVGLAGQLASAQNKANGADDAGRRSGSVPDCPFTRNMEWKGVAVGEPGYWCWSAWPVRADDGKYHLFGERWPKGPLEQLDQSELRHYVADKPEGPYTFVDVPVPRGKKGEFDHSQVYPCVQRDGKGWAMIYTGLNSTDPSDTAHGWSAKGFDTMRPGVALADSLDGPWRKMGMAFDLPKDPKHWAYPGAPAIGIHVATFVQFHGNGSPTSKPANAWNTTLWA